MMNYLVTSIPIDTVAWKVWNQMLINRLILRYSVSISPWQLGGVCVSVFTNYGNHFVHTLTHVRSVTFIVAKQDC